jgi:hypothetical protein
MSSAAPTLYRRSARFLGHGFRWSFAILVFAAVTQLAQARPENKECFDCHDTLAAGPAPKAKAGDAPAFPAGLFAKSVHAKLACVDCHADITDVAHDKLQPAQCA